MIFFACSRERLTGDQVETTLAEVEPWGAGRRFDYLLSNPPSGVDHPALPPF